MRSVLVVDDHPIVLTGCRRLLSEAGVDEVMEARTLAAGYRLYHRRRPEVVIADLAMQSGGLSGLNLVRRLRNSDPRLPILVFSMHRDPIIVSRALEAGATGYLLKETTPEEMLAAVETVRSGRPYMSHDLAMEVAVLATRRRASPLSDLTPREVQALSLLAEGRSYGPIAAELNVSYKTVVNTAANLKAKLGVSTLPELVRVAVQHLSTAPHRRDG